MPAGNAACLRGSEPGIFGRTMTPDERHFLWINRTLDGPVWTSLMSTVTWLGNGIVLALLVLPALYLLDRPAFRRHALPLVIVVALSGAAVNLAKIAVDRPRARLRTVPSRPVTHRRPSAPRSTCPACTPPRPRPCSCSRASSDSRASHWACTSPWTCSWEPSWGPSSHWQAFTSPGEG